MESQRSGSWRNETTVIRLPEFERLSRAVRAWVAAVAGAFDSPYVMLWAV